MAGRLIQVIPRTDFTFTLPVSTNQTVVLGPRAINTTDFVSGMILVLFHNKPAWPGGTATATMSVLNNYFDPADPTQQFLGSTSLITLTIPNGAITGTSMAVPFITTGTLPIGPSVQVAMTFLQSTTSSGPCPITMSVYLVGRDA